MVVFQGVFKSTKRMLDKGHGSPRGGQLNCKIFFFQKAIQSVQKNFNNLIDIVCLRCIKMVIYVVLNMNLSVQR